MAKKNSKKGIELMERRQFAVELRKAGTSYRDIAQMVALEYKLPNYDHTTALRDVRAAMLDVQTQMEEDAKAVLAMELLRLDHLQAGLWTKATDGNETAVNLVLRVMAARAELLGLPLVGTQWMQQALDNKATTRTVEGTFKVIEVIKDYGPPEPAAGNDE